MIAYIDFETKSAVDLRKCGVERYAESLTTSILCLAWCFDNGPVKTAFGRELALIALDPAYRRVRPDLEKLMSHVDSGGQVVAHNARFEINIWRMMTRRHGWPELRAEQCFDTMAMARALSLPGSLGELARALRLPVEKDDAGHRLMLKMCKPRKPRKGEPDDRLLWHEDPADLQRLIEYCARDVETEREAFKSLAKLSPREQALWAIDQTINDRGIYLDARGIDLLFAATETEKLRLAAEMKALTAREVSSANNGAKLLAWLHTNGLTLSDLKKGTVADALAKPITGEQIYLALHGAQGGHWHAVEDRYKASVWGATAHDVRCALEIRAEASKASTAKLTAMRNSRCADGRARGLLEYHGASTGRWAGRRIQTQNMPRTPDDFEPRDCENIIDWLALPNGIEGVRLEYPSVMDAASWSLRSLITAAPGARLMCADYSNIEGRGLAWLAGEDWKLQAFRDLDTGAGHDLYKLAYSKSFGIPVEDVSKSQRQIGKVQELALGYQGAHGAFLSMASGYGIDLDAVAAAVKAAVPPNRWQTAVERYWAGAQETAEEYLADKRAALATLLDGDEELPDDENELLDVMAEVAKRNRYNLGPDVWAAVRIVVDGWRDAHPYTVGTWRALDDAAKDAIDHPGRVTSAGRCHYRMSEHYLLCRLPSGRCLAYPYARIEKVPSAFDPEKFDRKFVFEGTDSRTKKWMKQRAYGGLLAENVTQAAARDVLAEAIVRLERHRLQYPVVMHVHDEIVSEVPLGSAHTLAEFENLMAVVPEWAPGFPIAVAGWEGERYRK